MDPNEDWSGDCQVGVDEQTTETEKQEQVQVIPGYSTFDDYVQDAFNTIRGGIKAANNLPIGSNYKYYSCFPAFLKAKDENVKLLTDLMQVVLGVAGFKGDVSNCDVEEKFDLLLETNDVLLDKANLLMDVECGITKNSEVELVMTQTRKTIVNGSWNNQTQQSSQALEAAQSVRLLAGKNVQRPQLMFKDKIDNSSKPWYPTIKDKPNSLKPLAIFLEEGENGEEFSHPYEFELDRFVPSDDLLKKSEPTKYKSLEETPLVLVEKSSDLRLLLDDLKQYKEIAIDLEHHSYRSFQGITCLMQISTGDKDYLIDTLSLRSELHELNEILTKPAILKVFHGADLDIQWLQRDLSLYVVNMFDTHQAAKQLNLPYLSLAYLLKKYCNIDPNKHFQLADWRIRPLPEELKKYAREDTHYLLYIKDVLRNALIDLANGQTNILKAVYDKSTDICKKTYVKPIWTEESCTSMYRKSQKMFNNKQLYALRELHKWRDQTAREEDDSIGYVLPNHMLLNIAETLPREMQGILACCNPIPPLVRQNLLKLHKIVLKAREQPLIKPVIEELRQRLTQRNQISNSEAWMYSPHDIPSGTEARADLPCLLDNYDAFQTSILDTPVEHTVTVFDSPASSEDEETTKDEQRSAGKKFVFVSPFERYKRVIPMVAEQEAQEREKERQEEENRIKKLQKEQEGTLDSKARVYDHFKQVSQIKPEISVSSPFKKPYQVPLSQMQGRKRKRDSNISKENETEEKSTDDMLSSTPSLETRIVQGVKRDRDDSDDDDVEGYSAKKQHTDEGTNKIHGNILNKDTITLTRSRTKGERKKQYSELKKKGMMPAKTFDYNVVDFSSFQGGSTNVPNQVNFQQALKKKKEKRWKKKKPKLNI